MSLLSYLDKGAEFLGYRGGYVTDLYETSFLSDYVDDAVGFVSGAYDKVTDFLDTKTGNQLAGYAMKQFSQGQKGVKAPQGRRVSGSAAGAVGQASYKASAVDMGFTPKVQQAYRTALNSTAGSSVNAAVQRIQGRPSKGPTIALGSSQIKVAPRSRA